MTEGETFDWSVLVPHPVHPARVAIIEALEWIEEPLSATDLRKTFGDPRLGVPYISYHLIKLGKIGALKVVSSRSVRGATEKFYFFR